MRASAFRRLDQPAAPAAADQSPAPAPAPRRPAEHAVVDCARYANGARQPGRLPLDAAQEAISGDEGFVWVGLNAPSDEQVAEVAERFHLPPLAVADAVRAHQRPKLDRYGDQLFAVVKPVRYVDKEEVVDVAELAIFLGPKFVVIVRHGESDIPARVRALAEHDRELCQDGPVAVLHRVLDLVVDGYGVAIDGIDENIDDIETQVFGGDEGDHAERIYKLKREVLEFRRAVKPLIVPVQRLASPDAALVEPAARPYFRDVYDHLMRSADAIENYDNLLTDVLQADLAQVSVRQNRTAMRQNEDMRRISAWAAIALVPAAVAGIYGMNFEHMPAVATEYGFYLVLAVIAGLCGLLYLLFRRNEWL